MTLHQHFSPAPADPRLQQVIKIAVLAVGGQGGGVLTSWIEDVARANGYAAQATSVAGVAQRTGATVYYIEIAPMGATTPVFSLAPAAGDVDVMIAAEMMEAGRSIMRGFVTPDRTTLIASTHRSLAVSEKMVPGDGIASSEEVIAAAEIAARQFIAADFDRIAISNGSVISASLFGALAGSGALPFPREAFEEAIRASGKGVKASLRAFDAAFGAAGQSLETATDELPVTPGMPAPTGPAKLLEQWKKLEARTDKFPAEVTDMARLGLRKVVNFQDLDYGREYLDQLQEIIATDRAERDYAFSREATKYMANAMAYDDVIRVADLKTREARLTRIKSEMGVRDGNLMQLTEFMHPRAEEIAGMMPRRLGEWFENSPKLMRLLDRMFNKGRRLRTDSLRGFLMLHMLGGMKGWRRRTLRHAQEQAHMQMWLDRALACRDINYDLGVEVIRCRRLVKGYSDTHSRGLSKFDKVLDGIRLIEQRSDSADWARRLREAALQDEEGKALDGALKTIASFAS